MSCRQHFQVLDIPEFSIRLVLVDVEVFRVGFTAGLLMRKKKWGDHIHWRKYEEAKKVNGSSRVPLQSSYSRFAAPLSPIILLNFAVKRDHCLEYVNKGIFWRNLLASGDNYFWMNLTAVLSAMLSLHARGFLSLHCTSMIFCMAPDYCCV